MRPGLISILGSTPRSGTNYLLDLLCCHSEIVPAPRVHEDGAIAAAHHLEDYVDQLEEFWQFWPEMERPSRATLLRSLGSSMIDVVRDGASSEVVVASKTPRVDGLRLASELWPEVPILVLVRDGRSVAESTARSWGTPIDVAARRWAKSIDVIRGVFGDLECAEPRYRLVRYEALVADHRGQMESLLTFCGLDPAGFDADRADGLALRGSSTLRGGENELHWNSVERPHRFDPNASWSNWDPADHDLFNLIAGDQMRWLGYEVGDRKPGLVVKSKATAFRARHWIYERPVVRSIVRSFRH